MNNTGITQQISGLNLRLDTVKRIQNTSPHKDVVKQLLREKARQRALSQRWGGYSLAVAYLVLAAVIVMQIEGFGLYLVGGTAAGGLFLVWLIAFLQGKRLEDELWRAEAEYYLGQFSADLVADPIKYRLVTGPSPLSTQEMEVLSYIIQGQNNRQIAASMNISEETVKDHITHILNKMAETDRFSAAMAALKLGWICITPEGHLEFPRNDPLNN